MAWYQWVFSGIGVTVITAGLYVFKRLSEEKRTLPEDVPEERRANISEVTTHILAPVTESQIATGSNISQEIHHYYASPQSQELRSNKLLPDQILAEIEAAAPFDQHHAREKYSGLDISWLLELRSITHRTDAYTVSFLDVKRENMVWVDFTVLPAEVRVSKQGAQFWVRGRIKDVERIGFTLEPDPALIVVDESKSSEQR